METFIKGVAFVLSFIISLFSGNGIAAKEITAEKENCRLNISIISDIHIEAKDPLKALMMKKGLSFISKGDGVDCVLVPGDLTNYADEDSLAKYYEYMENYLDIPYITAAGNHDIGHAGDRDVTDLTREECLANVIKYHNIYYNDDCTENYYSYTVNGYKFIVLGDEVIDGGKWDGITMSNEQLKFLDNELEEATETGNPVFVCCHWPIDHRNGEDTIWDDCGINQEDYDIVSIMEKYDNVFYVSGHMHAGEKSVEMSETMNIFSAEKYNGVTYINMPSYGLVNMYGYFFPGTGAQLEVYDDEVIFRPMNYITNTVYTDYELSFELD